MQQRLDEIKSNIALLDAWMVARDIMYSNQRVFEFRDHPVRNLARVLLENYQRSPVLQMQLLDGALTDDPVKKLQFFFYFYKILYGSDSAPADAQDLFFHSVEISLMNEEDRENLEFPIKLSEVISMIKALKLNKGPRIDGLTIKFYLKNVELLAPRLVEIFGLCLQQAKLPPSWAESRIILIPKICKDFTSPLSYRPILLLNTDYKILALILAMRLNYMIGNFIYLDQSSFLLGRRVRRVRRVMNIIDRANANNEFLILFFTDAEKAFDQVDWAFRKLVLVKIRLGRQMLRWVQMIYFDQIAMISSGGYNSDRFKINPGVK